jgi:uncharacterized peroxidase-related enzyme
VRGSKKLRALRYHAEQCHEGRSLDGGGRIEQDAVFAQEKTFRRIFRFEDQKKRSRRVPMPRISRLNRDQVSPSSVAIYDRYLRARGNVPYMFRTLAHRPAIFETIIAHMEAVLNTGTLPKALKELVIVRTSQLNQTPYCLASHTAICRSLGWSDVQIEALKDSAGSSEFSEAEKVAIHLAEVMTLDAHGYSDVDFARLRSFYSEGEVVELMAAIGLFNYFNRFNDLLAMEPTKPATTEELATAGVA